MARRRIQGITVEINGDTTKLTDSLKSVDKQLSQTQSQLKDVEKLLKMDPKNTELLAQKQDLLTDAVKGTKERLQELEKAQEELAKKGSSPELEKQQQALQREIIETKKKLEGFETELGKIPNKAQIAFEKVGKSLQDAGKKMEEVGESMTKYVTGPIAAIGAGAVAAFSEVDEAMDTVIKKTGATGEEMEAMQGIVEDLATTIPTDFQTAADAVGEINTRFGVTGDELEDLSSAFIKFAQLNDTTVSDSVDRTQKLMAAFGVETKDASKVLDVLNKAAQKSGIKVDKLADLMTSSAEALQEMGMSAAGAAEFLAAVETSGADVNAVMKGLQNANKKAAKEGKSLNEVLEDFSKVMSSGKSETDKLQAAIDLFGNKAGQSIYNAAKQGTLSIEGMTASLDDAAGSVTNTFDATVDGVDNWKMAMNEVKLLGSEVGGMLSEFAGPVLQKVRDALQEAVGWWRGLNDEQKETILKVAGVVAAIGPAVTVVGKLTSAVGLLSQGLGILAAHPVAAAVLGLTAAFAGLVVAVKNAGDAGDAYMEETYGVNSAMQENIDKIAELSSAYETSQQNKQEFFNGFDAEADYLKDLAEEYDSYLDKNGEVQAGYEARAEFIENEFSRALGLEREEIQKVIEENGNLSSSIDTIIEKRMAEAALTELQADYEQAIRNVSDAEQALLTAEEQLAEASEKKNTLDAEAAKWSKQLKENADEQNEAYWEAHDALADLRVDQEYANKAYEAASQAVEEAETTYKDYQSTIQQYKDVSAAIIEGDTAKIHKSLETFRQDFRTTETATTTTLKNQVAKYKEEYENTKKAVERGSKTVTQADLAEKAYWYKQAQLEYNKSTQQARDAAKDTAQSYATKIHDGRKDVEDATEYMGGGVKNPLKGVGDKAEDYGYDVAKGFADGISRNQSLATYAANNMANAVRKQLEQDLEIHSPSKVTENFGRMLDQGLAIGMDEGAAVTAAQTLARNVTLPFQGDTRNAVASANPVGGSMVDAFKQALSAMKIEMDDHEMGRFVENTVVRAVYA